MMLANLNKQLTIIEVKGTDATKFLQSQLTNDINQLNTSSYQFSAHLNNKGRMLASFIITKVDENSYYLITPLEIIEKIVPRLKMFVLRAMVTITHLSNINIIFGNTSINDSLSLELKVNFYLSFCNTLPENLNINAKTDLWKDFLINNGIPFIYLASQELFIPQNVNYDLINGINFKKGCYTGQEIVARTHYLGKVKKRMYQFTCKEEAKIAQKVISPIIDNQEAGIIVDFVQREEDYFGLIVLQIECIDKIFLDKENQHQLLIQPITYEN